jgi:hypothetical protein
VRVLSLYQGNQMYVQRGQSADWHDRLFLRRVTEREAQAATSLVRAMRSNPLPQLTKGGGRAMPNHHRLMSSSPLLPPDPSNELAMYLQTQRTVRESQM